MTDNTVLDALEGAKVKFSEINEPAYTGENCEFYEELLGKAIPIYKAEREIVEAAMRYCKLRALESPSFNQVQERIIELGNMYEAIENLKRNE